MSQEQIVYGRNVPRCVGPSQLLRSFCVRRIRHAEKCVHRQRRSEHDGHRTHNSCQPPAKVNCIILLLKLVLILIHF